VGQVIERIDLAGLMDDAKNAAASDKGENFIDSGTKETEMVSEKTGGKHDEQFDNAGDDADSKIGN
jgi:hypothetical protein